MSKGLAKQDGFHYVNKDGYIIDSNGKPILYNGNPVTPKETSENMEIWDVIDKAQ